MQVIFLKITKIISWVIIEAVIGEANHRSCYLSLVVVFMQAGINISFTVKIAKVAMLVQHRSHAMLMYHAVQGSSVALCTLIL
jgi:hypothetical protein